MPLESLLLSRDAELIRVLRPTLEKLAIDLEVCRGARSGNEIVCSEKFDAIIVDCDDLQGGLDVLRGLRKTESNKGAASFAVLNGKTTTQQAFEMGASFVLQKPLSASSALRCFSTALDMMIRERRRYFRHPIDIPVHLIFASGDDMKAIGTNISEGGMALRFRGKLSKGAISKVQFRLPVSNVDLEPKGEIAWKDGTGHCGVRFVEIPQNARAHLEQWLLDRMKQIEQADASWARNPEDDSSTPCD